MKCSNENSILIGKIGCQKYVNCPYSLCVSFLGLAHCLSCPYCSIDNIIWVDCIVFVVLRLCDIMYNVNCTRSSTSTKTYIPQNMALRRSGQLVTTSLQGETLAMTTKRST